MRRLSLDSALLAGAFSWILIGYFALTGRFGESIGGILIATAAEASMIGSALAVAHCVCGILIGARIEEGNFGLISVFLMATAFATFVLLVLKCFFLLLFVTGGPNRIPHDADLGVDMIFISWGSWFVAYKAIVRQRLRDEWSEAAKRR